MQKKRKEKKKTGNDITDLHDVVVVKHHVARVSKKTIFMN